MQLARCSDCKNDLPSDRFYRNRAMGNGLSAQCIDCTKKRENNRDPSIGRRSTAKFKSANRAVNLAHKAVYRAVKRGDIPPARDMRCECGKPANQYHHSNYADQLNVIPYCTLCHATIHVLERDRAEEKRNGR